MTAINDNAILDRIIENLKFTSNNLFGKTSNDPKFSQIKFGDPASDNKLAEAGNVCYVRMADRPLVATKKTLRMKADRKRKIETKEIWIIIVTDSINDLDNALRTLNDLVFKTKEVQEKNIFLKKSDGTLPISHDLTIFDVPRDIPTIGKTRQIQNIVCRYDFTSE